MLHQIAPLDLATEDLAAAAAAGDRDALGVLYERFNTRLVGWLELKTSRNLTLSEDIASQTWVNVATAIRRYTTRRGGFEAWLWVIAHNELNGHYRWTLRRREELTGDMLAVCPSDASDPVSRHEDAVLRERLAAAVRALASTHRQVLYYRFYLHMDLNETANLMDRKPNAIKQLQHRALKALGKRVSEADMATLLAARDAAAGSECHTPAIAAVTIAPPVRARQPLGGVHGVLA